MKCLGRMFIMPPFVSALKAYASAQILRNVVIQLFSVPLVVCSAIHRHSTHLCVSLPGSLSPVCMVEFQTVVTRCLVCDPLEGRSLVPLSSLCGHLALSLLSSLWSNVLGCTDSAVGPDPLTSHANMLDQGHACAHRRASGDAMGAIRVADRGDTLALHVWDIQRVV